jgi:hypothetical protein
MVQDYRCRPPWPHQRPSAPCSPVESIGSSSSSVTGLQDEVSVTTGESISRRRRDDQGKEDLKKSADRVLIASAPLLASSTRPPASIHQPSLLASPALHLFPSSFVRTPNSRLSPLSSLISNGYGLPPRLFHELRQPVDGRLAALPLPPRVPARVPPRIARRVALHHPWIVPTPIAAPALVRAAHDEPAYADVCQGDGGSRNRPRQPPASRVHLPRRTQGPTRQFARDGSLPRQV